MIDLSNHAVPEGGGGLFSLDSSWYHFKVPCVTS